MKIAINMLTPLCVGLVYAGTGNAQTSVTLSGLVDVYAGSMRNAGDPGHTAVVNSSGMTTSWFGFKGSEDLGDGLKASFNLSSFFQSDIGVVGRFSGDPFFSREANVGLSGGFGSVLLGRGLAPNFLPTILANPFGDSYTFAPLVLHASISTAGWPYTSTPADTGWSNEVLYTTPAWDGLTANLHYQFGEQSSNTGNGGRRNVGMNVLYFGGPLTLVAFYESAQISNPVDPAPITTSVGGVDVSDTRKDWMIGGAYDAGFAKFYASYGQSRAEVAAFSEKTSSAGLSVPIGLGFVLAAIAHSQVAQGIGDSRTTASLGYDYFLSKRTDLYLVAMRDQVKDLPSGNSVGAGIRHRF